MRTRLKKCFLSYKLKLINSFDYDFTDLNTREKIKYKNSNQLENLAMAVKFLIQGIQEMYKTNIFNFVKPFVAAFISRF